MSSASGRPPVSLTFVGSSLLSCTTSQIELDSLTWAGEQLFLRPDRLFFATGAQFLDSQSKHWKYGIKNSSKIRKFKDRRCLQTFHVRTYFEIFLKSCDLFEDFNELCFSPNKVGILLVSLIYTSESDVQKANIDAFNTFLIPVYLHISVFEI